MIPGIRARRGVPAYQTMKRAMEGVNMTHDERLRAAAEELYHHQAVGMNDTAECAQWAHRELSRLAREREAKIERTVAVLRRYFPEPNGGDDERP